MRNRRLVVPLIVMAGVWPGCARAVEFPPQGESGPPMTTSPSGFVGVPGPSGYAPEHSHGFPPLQPAPGETQSCPTCPVSGPPPASPPPQPPKQ